MMQMNEIRQRFNQVDTTVHEAARACQRWDNLPMDLKDSLQRLEQQTERARDLLGQSQDENQVRQCIDQLEDLGDRARDACERSSGNIDDSVKSAVMQAHRELSDLKHQLH
jgi:hypothetical protein